MSDLISRQKALDGLKYEMKYGAVIDQCGLDTAYDIIENIPSAEPERKKGSLIIGFFTCQCSECGALFHELEYTNFCPNCGADMRGE